MLRRSTHRFFSDFTKSTVAGQRPGWRRSKRAFSAVALAVGALASGQAQAQDVIVKNDKSELSTKVIEITDEHVKYRLFDFQDGPIYNIRKSDVWMIIYEKGRREKFGASETAGTAAPSTAAPAAPAGTETVPAPATPVPTAAVEQQPVATPAPQPAAVQTPDSAPAQSVAEAPTTAPVPAAAQEAAPAVAPATTAAAAPAAEPQPVPATPAPQTAAVSATGSENPAIMAAAAASAPVTAEAATAAPVPVTQPVVAPIPAAAAPAPVPAAPAKPAKPFAWTREVAVDTAPGQLVWTKLGNGPAPQKYVSPDGNILILKANFLMSIEKSSGKQLWMTKVEQTSSASLIGPGSPLIQVLTTPTGADAPQAVLLNGLTGQVVYKPVAAGKPAESKVVAATNVVVWEASDAGTKALVLNKQTGTRMAELKITGERAALRKVMQLPDNRVAVFSGVGVAVLDARTARLVYNVALKRSYKVKELVAPTEPTFDVFETGLPGQVCVLKDGYLTSLNLKTGQITGERELLSPVVMYRNAGKDELVIGKSQRKDKELALGVYNKNTCQEIKSAVLEIENAGAMEVVGGSLFVVSDASAVKQLELSTLKIKTEKSIKPSSGDCGLLFSTATGIGMLNSEVVDFFNALTFASTGKTRYYDPAGKAKLKVGDDVYFFAKGYLGRVNMMKGEEKLLLKEKLSIKLLEGEVVELEVQDDGVVVLGAQSIAKVDLNGKVVYNQYYAPPTLKVGSVVGYTEASAPDAGPGKTPARRARQTWSAVQRTFEVGGADASLAGVARATAQQYHLILTKADKDEPGRFKVLKVNKATGKVEGQAEVENRTSDYVFDPVDNVVYFFDVDSVRAYKI